MKEKIKKYWNYLNESNREKPTRNLVILMIFAGIAGWFHGHWITLVMVFGWGIYVYYSITTEYRRRT